MAQLESQRRNGVVIGAAPSHRAARQRRGTAQCVDHRSAHTGDEILFKGHLPAILEAAGRLDQGDQPDLDQILDIDHAAHAAMDVPGEPPDQRAMLAHERGHVGRDAVAAIGQRARIGELGGERLRAHAGSAPGAPITATTSTDLSSGTSKKLITGVSGRQVRTSFLIATRIAGWTTRAKGLASATSGWAARCSASTMRRPRSGSMV